MKSIKLMSRVALVRCEQYDPATVSAAIRHGLDLLGGIAGFVKPGERILLKPNVLAAVAPEKCVTTHPAVVRAVAECCLEAQASVSVGDSPGLVKPQTALKKSGIADVIQSLHLQTADFETGKPVSFPEGSLHKRFVIAQGVLDVDGMISLSKFKTHGFTRLTGAIKNQFGCIPGILKGEFHMKLPNVNLFSQMLVDLNRLLQPRLYIMDGIWAMEGDGPQGGTPKAMKVLLFSTDPAALDATVCRLIGLDPQNVLTLTWAEQLGLGNYHEDRIELLGDPLPTFQDFSFVVNRAKAFLDQSIRFGSPWMARLVKSMLCPRPVINPSRCTRCKFCVRMCPANPKALRGSEADRARPPEFDYHHCIRCYCCHEICPESAISLKIPVMGRVLRWRRT